MPLISPKALLTGAIAVALTFSGATVAHAQSSFTTSSENTTVEGESEAGNGETTDEGFSSEDSFIGDMFAGSINDDGELDPKEFSVWLNTINFLLRTMDSFLSLS